MSKKLKILVGIIGFVFLVLLVGSGGNEPEKPQTTFYEVVKVIDGDTVAVMVDDQKKEVGRSVDNSFLIF